jgi:hypothetical protein
MKSRILPPLASWTILPITVFAFVGAVTAEAASYSECIRSTADYISTGLKQDRLSAPENINVSVEANLACRTALNATVQAKKIIKKKFGLSNRVSRNYNNSQQTPVPKNAKACELYCDWLSKEVFIECTEAKGKSCANTTTKIARSCIKDQCSLKVDVPKKDQLIGYIDKWAKQQWGDEYQRVSTSTYLGLTGKPNGYLVFYSQNRQHTPESLRSSYQDYPSVAALLKAVDVSTEMDTVPIRGYWEGVPPEVSLFDHAVGLLQKTFGKADYKLVARHLSVLSPILEFKAAGKSYFFDTRSSDVGVGFRPIETEAIPPTVERLIRLEQLKREWREFLASG